MSALLDKGDRGAFNREMDRAELVAFTAAKGANYRCQPLGRQLTGDRMFNWLENRLG